MLDNSLFIAFYTGAKGSRCISTDGTDVDHSFTELDECASISRVSHDEAEFFVGPLPLDRDVKVSDVVKDKVDEGFVFFFSEEVNERLRRKLFP